MLVKSLLSDKVRKSLLIKIIADYLDRILDDRTLNVN